MNEFDIARQSVKQIIESRLDANKAVESILLMINKGAPADVIRPLLAHHDDSIAKYAAYILSELGRFGSTLESDTSLALTHHVEELRSAAISNVLANSDSFQPSLILTILRKYDHESDRIKIDTIIFISRLPIDDLYRAIASSKSRDEKSQLELFMDTMKVAPGNDTVLTALTFSNNIRGAFALAALKRASYALDALRRKNNKSDPLINSLFHGQGA
jgi:hypothetical protein